MAVIIGETVGALSGPRYLVTTMHHRPSATSVETRAYFAQAGVTPAAVEPQSRRRYDAAIV